VHDRSGLDALREETFLACAGNRTPIPLPSSTLPFDISAVQISIKFSMQRQWYIPNELLRLPAKIHRTNRKNTTYIKPAEITYR
jgi:hypothetical protein